VAAAVVSASMLAAGCGSTAGSRAEDDGVVVMAASSLSDVLEAVLEGRESVTPVFAASSTLVAQLAAGAEADVLITADAATMDRAVAEGSVRGALQRASVRARLRSIGVESIDPGALLQRTSFDVINVTESGEARSQDIYRALSFGIAFFFYFILLIYGQMIVRAILEEKQSDIVEIMVSSLRPWELMLGKIVGVGAVGIAQMAVWALVFALAAVYGLTAGASTLAEAGIDLASIPVPWGSLVLMFFFLIFGYLLYAGMFAGAGATISNEHDAQQVMLPITMLIILPFIATQGVIQSPNAGWGVILSLVPFFSPLVMPARLFATSVPVWQWLVSLVLLGILVLGAAWVAGRIFRVGILMKGQRANLPQVLRWIRHG